MAHECEECFMLPGLNVLVPSLVEVHTPIPIERPFPGRYAH